MKDLTILKDCEVKGKQAKKGEVITNVSTGEAAKLIVAGLAKDGIAEPVKKAVETPKE